MAISPIAQLNVIDTSKAQKKVVCACCGSPDVRTVKRPNEPREFYCGNCPSRKPHVLGFPQNVFAKETRVHVAANVVPLGQSSTPFSEGVFMRELVKEWFSKKRRYDPTGRELAIRSIFGRVWPRLDRDCVFAAEMSFARLIDDCTEEQAVQACMNTVKYIIGDSQGVGVRIKHSRIADFLGINPRSFETRAGKKSPPLRRFVDDVRDAIKKL